jgi:hypothetical protein
MSDAMPLAMALAALAAAQSHPTPLEDTHV